MNRLLIYIILLHFLKNVLCNVTSYIYNVTKPTASPYSTQVIDKTCLLEPHQGPCRSKLPMYYYKPETGNCSVFLWGGCQGNGNRFDTYGECKEKCLSKANPSPFYRPKWCNLRFDYGFCFGSVERWYYDSFWRVCKQVIYSGCGGNKNNFYTKERCDSVCQYGSGPLVKKSSMLTNQTNKINTFYFNPNETIVQQNQIRRYYEGTDTNKDVTKNVINNSTSVPSLNAVIDLT